MKKYLSIIMSILFCLLLVSCGEDAVQKKYNGNCRAVDCIKKITLENTIEEINAIIGFDGVLIDAETNKYYWEITSDSSLVIYDDADNGRIIKINFDKDAYASRNVDFSRYDEIDSIINSENVIIYSDFVTKIGNSDGILIEKSNGLNIYVWINSFGEFLMAGFDSVTLECKFVSSRFDR